LIASDGKLDVLKIRPIARLGYYDYAVVDSLFEIVIPGLNEKLRAGMEGAKNKVADSDSRNIKRSDNDGKTYDEMDTISPGNSVSSE
jgi:hypothetical protein